MIHNSFNRHPMIQNKNDNIKNQEQDYVERIKILEVLWIWEQFK